MEQLALSFSATAPVASDEPKGVWFLAQNSKRWSKHDRVETRFESDDILGIWFWHDDTAQYSSHPHALLPFHCEEHRRYSDKPCSAELHTPEALERRRWLDEQPVNEPMKRKAAR